MRLLEFQAKRIFSRYGIPVPKGVLIESPDGLDLEKLSFPAVLKAQVPVGGRGKTGGIRIVTQAKEAAAVAKELLASNIKGVPVQAVLAEEQAEIERELYLAILIDKQTNMPIIMASATGGVDIEEVARENPEQILKKHVEPSIGLPDYVVRYLGKNLGLG
ncbi:MAG: succinate--CoA ligase subunit beta, partial [Desulfobacteraceae bacterium 4484_190.1]